MNSMQENLTHLQVYMLYLKYGDYVLYRFGENYEKWDISCYRGHSDRLLTLANGLVFSMDTGLQQIIHTGIKNAKIFDMEYESDEMKLLIAEKLKGGVLRIGDIHQFMKLLKDDEKDTFCYCSCLKGDTTLPITGMDYECGTLICYPSFDESDNPFTFRTIFQRVLDAGALSVLVGFPERKYYQIDNYLHYDVDTMPDTIIFDYKIVE